MYFEVVPKRERGNSCPCKGNDPFGAKDVPISFRLAKHLDFQPFSERNASICMIVGRASRLPMRWHFRAAAAEENRKRCSAGQFFNVAKIMQPVNTSPAPLVSTASTE